MPSSEGWNREAIVTTTLVVVFFTTIVIGGLTEPVLRKVRVEASDEDDDSDFLPASHTGFSHMDLEFPATPHGSKRSMTKKGVHGCWKTFDAKHMKPCFGGPKDTAGSLVDNDNLGNLTPKATTAVTDDQEVRENTARHAV
mgnify:CR=1 FL=1